MMTEFLNADVVIVGGGIAGVSAAYHIAKRGKKAILLERGFTGSQASGVNFGGVRTNGREEGEMSLSLRAKKFWFELDKHIGGWCDFKATGHLEVSQDEKTMATMEKWAAMAKTHGQKAEMLTPRQISKRYPYVASGLLGGCLVPDDGSANPRLVVPTMTMAARSLGADIYENAPVVGFERKGTEFVLTTTTGLRVKAPNLINATGAWGDRVARHFGDTYPVETIAPQMIVSEPVGIKIGPTIDFCIGGRYLYFRQVERGNLVFGRGPGTANLDTARAFVDTKNSFNSSAAVTGLIPSIHGLNIIRTWAGIDGLMPDSMPVLGFSESVPNLIHGFGFSGHGFQLGPASGAVLAELALDGKTETDISAFRAGRFSNFRRIDSDFVAD